MDSDSIKQLVGIAAFVFVAGLVFILVDRLRRPVIVPQKPDSEAPFIERGVNRRSAYFPPPGHAAPALAPTASPVSRSFRDDLARVLDEHNRQTDEQSSAAGREQRFRFNAESRLEPLLDDMVASAKAHGQHAAYEMTVSGGRATYRLEVRRSDHPKGQPLPYLTIARGEKNDLAVLHGGMYPGPADHNYADTEIGWTEMPWGDLEGAILRFAKRVFRQYAP